MSRNINPAVGGNIETIIYDSTHPLTWNDAGGGGTVTVSYPVTVTVPTNGGVSADDDAFTTESIDLTNFDTMIIDINYEIDADFSGEVNAGDIIITVGGNSVFNFTMQANFTTRNDRFVLDISALSVSGIINISVGANGFGSADGDTTLTLNEMKLINRAI